MNLLRCPICKKIQPYGHSCPAPQPPVATPPTATPDTGTRGKEPIPPDRIYLQWESASEFDWSWAAERINDEDWEYVRWNAVATPDAGEAPSGHWHGREWHDADSAIPCPAAPTTPPPTPTPRVDLLLDDFGDAVERRTEEGNTRENLAGEEAAREALVAYVTRPRSDVERLQVENEALNWLLSEIADDAGEFTPDHNCGYRGAGTSCRFHDRFAYWTDARIANDKEKGR